MAGSLTNYWENKVINLFFGGTAYTPAATMYFALSSTDFGEAGTGGTEPSTGSYARKDIANTKAALWTTCSDGGAIENNAAITFVAATADWLAGVDIGYWAIFDAVTAGNCLAYGSMTTAKPVLNGDTATIAIGDLDITIT